MDDLGHWTTDCIKIEEPTGFVYLIMNKTKGSGYIGQKSMMKKVVRKPLKGRVNKRRSTTDSGWREYRSSSKQLIKDIDSGDEVTYHIICWCRSKSELNYIETKYQFDVDVINDERWYNGMINIRQGKTTFCEDWRERYDLGLTYIKNLIGSSNV